MTKAPNPVDKHVGSRLRLRRMALGLSQEKLGERLGLTFQQVQKYEKGANRIGASRLYHIAQILDVPVQYFFDELPGEAEAADDVPPVSEFISTSEGLELNMAFAKIKDPQTRRHLTKLVRSVAERKESE